MVDRAEIVAEWIAAFNARDGARLLALADGDVVLHPLRLADLDSSYRGHAGIQAWLDALARVGYVHRITVSELRPVQDDVWLAVGVLAFDGERETAPFSGVYEFEGPKLALVHHYFTPPETLRRLGIIGDGVALGRPEPAQR